MARTSAAAVASLLRDWLCRLRSVGAEVSVDESVGLDGGLEAVDADDVEERRYGRRECNWTGQSHGRRSGPGWSRIFASASYWPFLLAALTSIVNLSLEQRNPE